MFFIISCDDRTEKNYCGTIVDKGYEAPTSGYKSKRDPVYFVIMKVDSINKNIRINVTIPTYYELNNGDRTCIELTGFEMRKFGNTSKPQHLIK
jgi:hypothetical protein